MQSGESSHTSDALSWSCRYKNVQLVEINAHSLFSKWFSESAKLVRVAGMLVPCLQGRHCSSPGTDECPGFLWQWKPWQGATASFAAAGHQALREDPSHGFRRGLTAVRPDRSVCHHACLPLLFAEVGPSFRAQQPKRTPTSPRLLLPVVDETPLQTRLSLSQQHARLPSPARTHPTPSAWSTPF